MSALLDHLPFFASNHGHQELSAWFILSGFAVAPATAASRGFGGWAGKFRCQCLMMVPPRNMSSPSGLTVARNSPSRSPLKRK